MPSHYFDDASFDEALGFDAQGERAAFFSLAPERLTGSPNQRAFFQSHFPTFRDAFRGYEGRNFRNRVVPQQNIADFALDYPFLQEYLSATQGERAASRRRLAPSVRYSF